MERATEPIWVLAIAVVFVVFSSPILGYDDHGMNCSGFNCVVEHCKNWRSDPAFTRAPLPSFSDWVGDDLENNVGNFENSVEENIEEENNPRSSTGPMQQMVDIFLESCRKDLDAIEKDKARHWLY
jgi:hypothetical protein